jgi:hypothetical protein
MYSATVSTLRMVHKSKEYGIYVHFVGFIEQVYHSAQYGTYKNVSIVL